MCHKSITNEKTMKANWVQVG